MVPGKKNWKARCALVTGSPARLVVVLLVVLASPPAPPPVSLMFQLIQGLPSTATSHAAASVTLVSASSRSEAEESRFKVASNREKWRST